MKRLVWGLLLAMVVVSPAVFAAMTTLKTDQERLSYSMGVMTGKAFEEHGVVVNAEAFSQGMSDAMAGKKTLMTDDEMQSTLNAFEKESVAKMEKQQKEAAAKNATAEDAFFSANAKKPGVKKTADGLQYKVVTAGAGVSPVADDVVTVNYEGKLLDGTVFDSSYKRGKPATFPVGGVIPGWQEALKLMKPGAVWEVYIPSKLAYGERGAPGAIGPNEALVFKINLISVKQPSKK